jgi:hypothetical protein
MRTWQNAVAALFTGLAIFGEVQALPVSGQGTWEATLKARDLTGDGVADAFYDTTLNITWLADASAAGGTLTAEGAREWASTLVVGEITGWRLPAAIDLDAPGCNFSFAGGTDCGYNSVVAGSEMVHMYYVTLGNEGYFMNYLDVNGGPITNPNGGLKNMANFANLQPTGYWTGTEANAPYVTDYISFWFEIGMQSFSLTAGGYQMGAWAVHDGDVAAVPEPSTYVLILVGLATLVQFARRHKVNGGQRALMQGGLPSIGPEPYRARPL